MLVWPVNGDLPPVNLTIPASLWQDEVADPLTSIVTAPEPLRTPVEQREAPAEWDWDSVVTNGQRRPDRPT